MNNSVNQSKQSSFQVLSLGMLQSRVLLRLMFIYGYFSFLSILIGLAFWLIFSGIFWVVFKLAPYWEPAYKITAKLMGVRDIDKEFTPVRFLWYLVPLHCISIGVRASMIGFGIWMLIRMGFLQQNLIYMLFVK